MGTDPAVTGGPTTPPAELIEVQQVTRNGRDVLALVQHGQSHDVVIYLAPEHAETIGTALATHGRRLRSGLVLPPSPNGHG